ncbi:hypothetical protein [Clostridium estertheticum]|uniref:Uncharacterized protein n=1 Tax=Clostridium estertheticum TaxID=238834 RepID=A0AA47EJP6_9CLOT|nr:hypothetical protein [Clostridium estertheticum]MBU3153889.1 hypothetical protein [Clostridium estertheticum]WAG61335.1 hypothetical protein LL038_03520 [Clostridium estertheticum]
MADISDVTINIEMRERNANNTGWIIEHPKTTSKNVDTVDDTTGTIFQLGINNGILYIKAVV